MDLDDRVTLYLQYTAHNGHHAPLALVAQAKQRVEQ